MCSLTCLLIKLINVHFNALKDKLKLNDDIKEWGKIIESIKSDSRCAQLEISDL